MKKTLKIFTAFAVLCATMSQFTAISAATGSTGNSTKALKATTKIEAIIKEAGVAGGDEADDDKVVEDIDEDSDQNAGENTGNGDNDGSFGGAQLAIWRKPGNMKFQGKYSAFSDYALHFQPKPGHKVLGKTEIEFDNLSQEVKYNATEIGKKSMISIADVRDTSDGWNLKVTLPVLELQEDNTKQIAQADYRLEAKMKAFKHLQEPGKVHVYQFAKDSHSKYVNPQIKTAGGTELSPETASDAKIGDSGATGGETNNFAYTANTNHKSPSRGYTALVLEDMKLVVNAARGAASNKSYEGEIIWTLSAGQPGTDQ